MGAGKNIEVSLRRASILVLPTQKQQPQKQSNSTMFFISNIYRDIFLRLQSILHMVQH